MFKENIEVLDAYNRGVLFGNSPEAMAGEITTLRLDAEIEADVEKAQVSARGKYLATAFLLRLYRQADTISKERLCEAAKELS